ncbi:GSCFA domain-containing protein [Flavobacteriales bacterium]|nr:GSCFA domain-containing protein [Flavobacteriales bacterium]
MNFKTEIKLPNYPFSISHQDSLVIFGSCFSENIGAKLKENKFDVNVNPYGILFNPISVTKAIEECIDNKQYSESDLNDNNEIHFSFNHHSKFSGLDRQKVLDSINNSITKANSYLTSAKVLIITFGTAWVYRLKETNEVVANCYKLPNSLFVKELLTVKEITKEVSKTIKKLKAINPSIKIITTISPVRHWKDGVVENKQSKATLHLALKEINESVDDSVYFPSNEIMLDELRDYRFYANDMLHPSELAIDYIWEKFADSFFSKETKELNKRVTQINRERNHKPFNPESKEFIEFSKQLEEKENQLYIEFPCLKER